PSQIDKYLAAAETILAEAYPSKPASMLNFTKRAIGERQVDESHRERLRQLGLLDKVRYEMWPGDIYRYTGSEPLPASGVYEISYTLSGLKPSNGRAPRLFVYETSLDRVLHEQDVIAPEDQPIKVTFQAHLPAGRPNIFVINDVPGPSNNPRSGRHGRTPFISTQEGRIPWQMKLTDEQGRPRYPFLILDTVAFRGPIVTAEEQQRRNHYLPEVATDAVQIRGALHRFATRAFRRPVEPSEVDGFVRVVESELSAGETSLDALKAGMQAILCSKDFLFITEGDERADRSELNNYELATRMSYLFWSTLPDEELLALAERGELSRPEVRAQQALRLLADERASRFSNSFSSQWLQLHKLGQFQPDKKLYPDYDLALQRAMAGETQAYFHQVLTENLTLREFLDSNWTMLNARMAVYYGIEDAGVVGDQFCKVRLPRESHRGGILTQAAVLSMTSDGTRHRPVHRGKWVSEVVFNRVPPPPPANVDPIMPNPLESPKATLRAKLEAHTHDRRCAACHRRIDPFGLAFENFDAIGRWRTAEKTEGTGDDPPVDPSGQLPNGQPFASPEEFKHLLVEDVESFNRAFVEKLASYGMRRATSFVDREELASIAAASRSAGYRLRELVIAFVTSDLFARR
ncbi:MAG TPA: DUF1592 domain-containing protein, partial [Caulifigura sp.]|nr:DUF1592 domain-containing protein [Caulifigura sp.]